MADSPQHGMGCADFEAHLAEAVEGSLAAAQMEAVRAHGAACSMCGPLFAEAAAGYRWTRSLGDAEPPAGLVQRIVLATSGAEPAKAHPVRREERSPRRFLPWMAPILQPRFAATFAMAFFSVAVLLNLAGVRITNLRPADLRPSALRAGMSRQYYETSARVMKYYDSVRLVYELQSRVRELKNTALPAEEENRPAPRKKEKNNRDISDQPDEQKNENRQDALRIFAMQFAAMQFGTQRFGAQQFGAQQVQQSPAAVKASEARREA